MLLEVDFRGATTVLGVARDWWIGKGEERHMAIVG
jgi:hypothetical protein